MISLDISKAFTEYLAKYVLHQVSKNLMELHKDFIPIVLFYCMHAFLCRTFIRKYYNCLLPRRTIFFIEQNLGDFFCMELQKNGPLQLACYGFAYFAYTRVSEGISCEESAIFFANLAYIPHIRQNYSTFPPIATKINP